MFASAPRKYRRKRRGEVRREGFLVQNVIARKDIDHFIILPQRNML